MFIFKFGFNTPQLAVADLKRLKLPVAESEKFRGKYSVACCGDSEILGNFFMFLDFSAFHVFQYYWNYGDYYYGQDCQFKIVLYYRDIPEKIA